MIDIKIKFDDSWRVLMHKLQVAQVSMPAAMRLIAAHEGEELRAIIVKGIKNQAPGGKPFLPHARLTLITRLMKRFRGKKIMQVTNQLVAGIQVTMEGGKAYIGVPENIKREERGQELYRIALIQEHGGVIVIRRTVKMQRFLMALMRKAGLGRYVRTRSRRSGKWIKSRFQPKSSTKKKGETKTGENNASRGVIVVRIPPRPYIAPAVKIYVKQRKQMEQRVAALLLKKLFGNTPGVKTRR